MGAHTLSDKLGKDTVMQALDGAIEGTDVKSMPGVMFSVGRSAWVGCLVSVNGKKVNTMPMAHGLGMMMLMILVLLSGIGLVLYAVIAIPKQKKLVDEVDAMLAEKAL